jgi:tetratricopeptide (TPR) repeat protein
MSDEFNKDPRRNFVPRFLPWLLGAAMFALYWFTVNHWVSLLNIGAVAQTTGLTWQPQMLNPLAYLATLPLRWLAPASVPLALNLFAAACAALALVVLARCVALLPHDRTETERQREKSDFSFLTGWPAWWPPIFAVVVCGLQLTLWQHATNFTGEAFDLLLFAVVVWQLLEHRLDERDGRLYFAAFVFGAGMTNNCALFGFIPLFLAAIIWLKGLMFFRIHFLGRLFACGFIGLLFLAVIPVMAKMTGSYPIGLGDALKPSLMLDWSVIRAIKSGGVLRNVALMSLTTLLPLLVMGIRWSASFGDSSRLGMALTNLMVHIVYAAIFSVGVWICLNPPFSPEHLLAMPFMSSPCLPLYFLAALGIGYFCGYFLLVFGRKSVPSRRVEPQQPLPEGMLWLCPVVVGFTFVSTVIIVGALYYRNHEIIKRQNDNTLLKYAELATQNLPRPGAILLCDSDDSARDLPLRSFLIQSMLIRQGRWQDYPVVDTQSLQWLPYQRFLHRRFPKVMPAASDEKSMGGLAPLAVYNLVGQLAKSNTVCYLNPSYGYYFEQFYLEPHGMNYRLKPLPEDTLLPPVLEPPLVALNEKFWAEAASEFPPVEKSLGIQKDLASGFVNFPRGPFGWLLMHLHANPEPDMNDIMAGRIYSRSLNYWGVHQQRANALAAAKNHFTNAIKINPDNVAAAVNLKFNQALRTGSTAGVELTRITADQFGKYRGWNEILNANGPFDETSFVFENAVMLMQSGLMKQAVVPFTRVRQLLPDNLAARLFLAQIYIFAKQPDRALDALNDPLTQPGKFFLTTSNSTEINILAASIYFQKDDNEKAVALMDTEVDRHPEDDTLLQAVTQAYFLRGLYTNALPHISRKLVRSPNDPLWLFGQGYASLQVKQYDDAINAMSHYLNIVTNDASARFNRALAYLQSERLPEARQDYATLQTTYTNSFQVAYGLGEIAWRTRDTNAAIRNYQLYLANAPTNTAEATNILTRLAELRGQ